MRIISYTKKLDIQIAMLGQLKRFFDWHERRWNAWFEKRKWDRWFATFEHMKEMEKTERVMILSVLPYKDLEEAMDWKQWSHVINGGEMI